jgi:hypothetical protein
LEFSLFKFKNVGIKTNKNKFFGLFCFAEKKSIKVYFFNEITRAFYWCIWMRKKLQGKKMARVPLLMKIE